MTTGFDQSQTNTDAGLSPSTDFLVKTSGDQIPDDTMSEIARRLVVAIRESGFQDAIDKAFSEIEFPESDVPGLAESEYQLLRQEDGDFLLENKDVPFPHTQKIQLTLGGSSDNPLEHQWAIPFTDGTYMYSITPLGDPGINGRIWIERQADFIKIHHQDLPTNITYDIFAWDTVNRNEG